MSYRLPPGSGLTLFTLLLAAGALCRRLARALGELIVDGVDTTVPLFHALLQEDAVLTGDYNIHWLEHWLEQNLGDG